MTVLKKVLEERFFVFFLNELISLMVVICMGLSIWFYKKANNLYLFLTFFDIHKHNYIFLFCLFLIIVFLIFSFISILFKPSVFWISLFFSTFLLLFFLPITYSLYIGQEISFLYFSITRVYSLKEKWIIFLEEGLRCYNLVRLYDSPICFLHKTIVMRRLSFYMTDWLLDRSSIAEIKDFAQSRLNYIMDDIFFL